MPAAVNVYGSLCAEIYDLDKPPGSLGDIPHYLKCLKDVGGRVLEPAVGTGRMLIPLLEAGLDVEGFDHSPAMLEICRHNCTARGLSPSLKLARFQDFLYERPFHAIIVPVGSFILVDDFDEALAVLRRFRDHLVPGGVLLLDLHPYGGLAPQTEVSVRAWTAANGDLLRMESRTVEVDYTEQRKTSHFVYERWRGGQLVQSELDVFVVRMWGVRELEMALKEAGFTAVAIFGGYERTRPPCRGDGIISFEAKRPG